MDALYEASIFRFCKEVLDSAKNVIIIIDMTRRIM